MTKTITVNSLMDIRAIALYLNRIGAKERSLRTAVVEENHGAYWKNVAVIRFNEGGDVDVEAGKEDYLPTAAEAAAIRDECAGAVWPHHKLITRLVDLPPDIKNAKPTDIYEFRNEKDEIIMLQLRNPKYQPGEKGGKYHPWTYWSDGMWRRMEPEGKLPLFNLHKLKDNATVFIHEGAKAANYVQWMIEAETADAKAALGACPWGEELKNAVHLGWIGGALSANRTDWSALKRNGVQRAYIVSDNDTMGKSAVPEISEQLRFTCFAIQFTDEWPGSFDLADEWPPNLFSKIGGRRYYNGPSFRSCQHPATFATDVIPPPNGKGKGTIVLRDSFKDIWAYVEEADLFVCTEMPDIIRAENILNKMLGPYSHAQETSKLMVKAFRGRQTKLCYRPDMPGRIVTNKSTAAINLHIPTTIKAQPGDPTPFLEFMNYLFKIDEERLQALKWCATLIARPEVHMEYGMLLVSEKQGIGKTTLGSSILAPLVGDNNASFPSENDITSSDFNGWLAHTRLAVVNEIYSGHSWKAYNRLKNYITDKEVSVNQKFQRSYTIENWCHIFACSNSMRALRMEDDDRRWFYPEVNEKRWPSAKFGELHSWLNSGGLQIIMNWAMNYGEYVKPGERAPMTERKQDLIEGSRTDAQREVVDLARALVNQESPGALAMKDIEQWTKTSVKGKVFDSDYDLRKVMKEEGLIVYDKRIMVGGRLQYALMNNTLERMVLNAEPNDRTALINKSMKHANDLLSVGM